MTSFIPFFKAFSANNFPTFSAIKTLFVFLLFEIIFSLEEAETINSLKNKIYIQKANGEIQNVVRGRFKRPEAGDTIVVPADQNPQDFDTASFVADILSVLTNLIAILAIVDNTSNNN